MIIRAKGKVKWFEDSLWNQEGLKLKVVFKLPNTLFPIKLSRVIVSRAIVSLRHDESNSKHNDFWESCFYCLENKESVMAMAKSMIVDYIEEKYKETLYSNNKKKVQELLKDYKFEMEFEYTQDDKKTID